MLHPNRPLSILITTAGVVLFSIAAFDLLPLQRDTFILCLFFGLLLLAGGVVLLLIKVESPASKSLPDSDELLGDPKYEAAFRIVVGDQSKRGKVDEESIQSGIDYLVANGVAPDIAWENLRAILRRFAESDLY